MKKSIFIMLVAIVAMTFTSRLDAQTQQEKITVNTSDLTVDQLAKIKADQAAEELQSKLETYGKWVGVGGEIGTAVREGLNAVVDVSDKFGKTDVGKFTIYMIAWKVMGKDVLRIVFGIILITVFTPFIFRYYKTNFMTYNVKTKSNGLQFWLPSTYEIVQPNSKYDGYQLHKFMTLLGFLGGYAIIFAIMFT